MKHIKITKKIISQHGITDAEYTKIMEILGREPNITELGIFSVMWSEHCSYKNSKKVLKLFPTDGKGVLVKAGEENAGCIDIGDGLAIVFKIESHNHPSAIEPFQGAATGVGGILRDIFTMGARPIMCVDSLRFGSLDNVRVKRLFKGVVEGIAHYGNCMGIPTVGGEVYFDDSYEGNPLVNVMGLGIIKKEDLIKGKASGIGNPVFYVGAATGKDGLGGASFASRDLTEASHEDRPAVQVGDPFLEKLLLEACLELNEKKLILGMQDLGAAGLTCSTCETASRGETGITIDISKVPRRDSNMNPYEVMLSESQERMLLIVEKGNEQQVEDVLNKWDLHAVQIGTVTEGHQMKVYDGDELVADIPADVLADSAPVYTREEKKPAYLKDANNLDIKKIKEPQDCNKILKQLLDDPSIASKRWVYQQYDHMVRTNTIFLPGHDAALVRLKGTNKAVAVSTDCNSLYCYLNPYEGGKIAIAEAARNVACSGARPIAFTNCLNFGNPMNPERFWQLKKCVEGMAEAARALTTPCTGGNVSLYNESPQASIYPTPTVGMVGILDDVDCRIPSFFTNKNDLIFLIGQTKNEIGGSQYLSLIHGLKKGPISHLDITVEATLQKFLVEAAQKKVLASAHDISDGGFAVALAECSFLHGIGAEIDVARLKNGIRTDALLFGESQSRVIVSVSPTAESRFLKLINSYGLPVSKIGTSGGQSIIINDYINIAVTELYTIYEEAIPRRVRV
ncbi:MAG: phosphoribosylformylglycinamidine synthase subunit PurL [Candidatus Omnitrophica bacterium]|nr:phosphoribosylformylglycinamidine synthase subunit PurL [Candidatus Omnitrophota bacterium]